MAAYALDNALFQWQEGDRRVREAGEPRRSLLEDAVDAVSDELRKRHGSTFTADELVSFYASGTDWATEVAEAHGARDAAADVVDAAFNRYAREASNFGGGRARVGHDRP
jgi:hypothetical protein